jgi:hypothetical protein
MVIHVTDIQPWPQEEGAATEEEAAASDGAPTTLIEEVPTTAQPPGAPVTMAMDGHSPADSHNGHMANGTYATEPTTAEAGRGGLMSRLFRRG